MDQDTTEIIETLNLILAQMATKDDVEALRVEMREGFANIQTELKDIRLRIDALEVATPERLALRERNRSPLATRRRYREAPWHSPQHSGLTPLPNGRFDPKRSFAPARARRLGRRGQRVALKISRFPADHDAEKWSPCSQVVEPARD